MTKELEAIEWVNGSLFNFLIETKKLYCQITFTRDQANEFVEEFKRLEAIDNSNPSEALECLEYLYEDAKIESGWVKERCITYAEEHKHNDRIKPYYNTIKQALTTKSKKELAFDLIVKKNVNIASLKVYDLEEYNMIYENKLTKEEFDLLKEVVCNGNN